MRDEQKNERGIMQAFRDAALKGAEVLTGRPVYIRCRSCGEWIERGDRSACGSHPPIPKTADPIYVNFTAAPEPALPEPPTVERLGRSSDGRQVSRFKDPTKVDPLSESPEQTVKEGPKPYWAEDPDFNPNASAYRRKTKNTADWGMTSKELNEAMDRAEFGEDIDAEEETPTTPRYGL